MVLRFRGSQYRGIWDDAAARVYPLEQQTFDDFASAGSCVRCDLGDRVSRGGAMGSMNSPDICALASTNFLMSGQSMLLCGFLDNPDTAGGLTSLTVERRNFSGCCFAAFSQA